MIIVAGVSLPFIGDVHWSVFYSVALSIKRNIIEQEMNSSMDQKEENFDTICDTAECMYLLQKLL